MNIILEITKEICEKTQLFNISYRKKVGEPLKHFFWPCFQSMLPHVQEIHLKRSSLLYYSGAYQAPAEKQHAFFIDERKKAGWILEEKRLDYVWENDQMIWVGHDPYLLPLKDCPGWFQEWCIARNTIAENVVKKYLTTSQKAYN